LRGAREGQRPRREGVGQRLRLQHADAEGERETGVAERITWRELQEVAQRGGGRVVKLAVAPATRDVASVVGQDSPSVRSSGRTRRECCRKMR